MYNVQEELRRDRRVSAQLPFVMRRLDNNAEISSVTATVSARGLSFLYHETLSMGLRCRFSIEVPGVDAPVEVAGSIVRLVREDRSVPEHEYGVQFDRDEPIEPLAHYVRAVDVLPLLKVARRLHASVVHVSADAAPLFRVGGELTPLEGKVLTSEAVEALVLGVMNEARRRTFHQKKELDMPLHIPEAGRWRVSAFYQRGNIEAVFRAVDTEIPTFERLGLPSVLRSFALAPDGLVVLTGPKASGKSTTLAAMIDEINGSARKVILTIERPIEYSFPNRLSLVRQRDVGADSASFAAAIESALLQDPDVLVLSEVPDGASLDLAVRAIEMGHLVIIVMATHDPAATIDALSALAPPAARERVLDVVAGSLRGIVSQRLLPRQDGQGMALTLDIVVPTDVLRSAIRNGRLAKVSGLMYAGQGACSVDANLKELVTSGVVSVEHALQAAIEPDRLRIELGAGL